MELKIQLAAKVLVTFFIAICLLTSCIPIMQSAPPSLSCEEQAFQADKQYSDLPIYQARKIYATIVDQCPDDINSRYRLAVIDLKIGDIEESTKEFLKVITLDHSYAKAFYNLAVIYSSATPSNNLLKAKVAFLKYIELVPNSSKQKKIKAWLKKHKKIPIKGIYLIPKNSVDYKKAIAAYKSKEYMGASQLFTAMLEQDSNNIEVRSKLAVCYLKLDKLEKSRDEFLKILLINDAVSSAYYNLGVLYSAKSNFRNLHKTQFFFKKYLQLKPNSPQTAAVKKWLISNKF